MEWIFDHFQVFVIFGVLFFTFVKKYLEAKAEERQVREERQNPPDIEDIFGPGDVWQPAAPSVPPPLKRQQVNPPLPKRQVNPPPFAVNVNEDEVILKRQRDMQERLRQIKETKVNTSGGAAATRARVSAQQSHAKKPLTIAPGIREALRNRKQIRQAVILREILDPPVSLR